MDPNITNQTLDLMKTALSKPSDDITKSITTGSNLVAYDLQAPAKNLYPVITPLRNSIPRVNGRGGVATNWRTVSALTGSGFDSSPWVAEGQRSARMSYTTAPKAANYVTIGEEDQVTFEAVSAGQGFEDVRATMAMRLLQKAMIKEESGILAGNNSLALGTPTTPTVTAPSTGGAIGAGTYNVIVVAMTLEGWLNSTRSGTLALATTKTITGADGATYVVNGGISMKSAAASTGAITGSTNVITGTTPVVNGAIAYGWYVGTAGNETLQAITTINSVSLTSLSGGNQNASAVTADWSQNSLGFDGLLTTAFANSTTAYVKSLATGTVGTGTALTASGRGSISEIDTMLKTMWDNNRLGADVIYVNSQELLNITNKVLSNGSAPLLQYFTDPEKGAQKIAAGGGIEFYFNPFTADGGRKIPIRLHPLLPPGTIMGYAQQLPAWYQANNVSNVAEVHCRRDYYQLDYPVRTRAYETGVYSEEVLAVYAPFATAVITNVANG